MIDANHVIDMPPMSVRLEFTMTNGEMFSGTGFCVDHEGVSWLITCRHNVENRSFIFTGANDLAWMAVGDECEINFDDSERRVVSISVGGFIPDCAAIELRPHEWSGTAKFSTDIRMTMKSSPLPKTVRIRGESSNGDEIHLQPVGMVFAQGFQGDEKVPTTFRGVRLAPLPTVIKPWMPAFVPGCVEGFSGGPVLDVTDTTVSLLGITTHKFDAEIEGWTNTGKKAVASMPASACVPIRPLLWALKKASSGTSTVDVPAPGARG